MSDYRWNFPASGLALALDGLAALRTELGLPDGAMPGNALGDPRDATGTVVQPDTGAAWIGRPGAAASTYKDPAGNDVEMPAKGDPGRYYMHIRTDADAPGFDPAQYGMEPTDPAESAAVLGVWAGDSLP